MFDTFKPPMPWLRNPGPGWATTHGPGLLVCITIAIAATYLAERLMLPDMVFALVIGMTFHFVISDQGRANPGVEFVSKRMLRWAVGLLGAQVTVFDLLDLGGGAVAICGASAAAGRPGAIVNVASILGKRVASQVSTYFARARQTNRLEPFHVAFAQPQVFGRPFGGARRFWAAMRNGEFGAPYPV